MSYERIREEDPELYELMKKEEERQERGIELIPSENIVSKAVLEAMGSILTNKYSEGYPHKRYYGGNEYIDEIEELAINRAKKLFNAEHANVQPYSGSPANLAVYHALIKPGDKFLAMNLTHGGHLTHGHKVNFSGKYYHPVHYGVRKEDELIDFDQIRDLARKEKPKIIEAGYTAYPRKIDWKQFREICDENDAYFFVDMSHIAGLIAGKALENPVPIADVVTTTTHKTLRGPRGAMILCKEELARKIDRAVFPGLQGGPHEHIIAGKAVAFKEAMSTKFQEYAEQIIKNAKKMAEALSEEEKIRLISKGTDTHLILADLTRTGVSGAEAETALDKAGIYVNKNTIPFEPRTPFDPSGIRMGTPSITTRGMKEAEAKKIGELIISAIRAYDDDEELKKIRSEAEELSTKFSLKNLN